MIMFVVEDNITSLIAITIRDIPVDNFALIYVILS